MKARVWTLTVAAVVAAALVGGGATAEDAGTLRVCGDPDNLPFSNRTSEGFENRIAEVVARDLGLTLAYYWWPHQRGLVRNTLRAGACDVLISIPRGYDPVLWTAPYYRSAYVLAQLGTSGRKISSLDDPALRRLRIGTYVGSPPYDALAERGLAGSLVTYPLFFDPRVSDPSRRPVKMLEDVVAGELDVAVAWGPMAGYFAKKATAAGALVLVPLSDEKTVPMTFEFSMGVAKGNQALKRRLEEAIDRRRAEITRILDDYGVPLLPLTRAAAGGRPDKAPEPSGGHPHHE